MPKFSNRSQDRLSQCHPLLQELFNYIIQYFDCTIITGHRGREEQNDKFNRGLSKVKWPNSKHNTYPSRAVDAAPFIDGQVSWDSEQCYYFSGFVMGVAKAKGINIRSGSDWDRDNNISDQSFNDLVHFELID